VVINYILIDTLFDNFCFKKEKKKTKSDIWQRDNIAETRVCDIYYLL